MLVCWDFHRDEKELFSEALTALCDAVRAYCDLNVPAKEGETSLREQLESLEKQGHGHDDRLDSVHVPDGWDYLWEIFWDLRSGLADGFSGRKITWRDFLDYQSVTGYEFSAWEIEALRSMDAEVIKWQADQRRET